MFLIGYNYFHGKAAWTIDRFVDYLDLPGEPLQRTLRTLVDAGYLIEVDNDGVPVYLPLLDIENIRIIDVLTDVRCARESRVLSLQQLTPVRTVVQLMSELNAAQQTVLGDRTLRSMVLAVDEALEAASQVPVEE
jgi:hypothetical protein